MVEFEKIYKQIIPKLELELPSHLYYHNVKHTIDVLDSSILIAEKEGVTPIDLMLIKTAAVYHDAGFLVQVEGHETISCAMVREDMVNLGLSIGQIKTVCGIIMATRLPQTPTNLLEKIVADADLEYLGTSDYDKRSRMLYKEMQNFDPLLNIISWLQIQIDFLESHTYHTEYCKKFREPIKLKNLAKLIDELAELKASQ